MDSPRFRVAFAQALLAALCVSTACGPLTGRIPRNGASSAVPGLAATSRFTEAGLFPVVRLWAWRGDDGDPFKSGFATGVFVRSDGLLITNAHVVDGAKKLHVFFESGATFPARILGLDPLTDLALLQVSAVGSTAPKNSNGKIEFPVIRWGDSDRVVPGEPVYAVGHPFGLHRSVSLGIVSALPEPPPELAGLDRWIQTDASINPGNSGGPILNSNGEMIGLASAILSRSGGSHGVGFAVPSQDVRRISERLLHEGKIDRGWMGITGQRLNPDLAMHFLPPRGHPSPLKAVPGVLVANLHPASPAFGKLEVGDVLLQLDGRSIPGPAWLRARVQDSPPGATLVFRGVRHQQPFEAEVVAAGFPLPPGLTPGVPGARAGQRPPERAKEAAKAERTQGMRLARTAPDRVKIAALAPGSPAFLSGLQPGDLILSIDGRSPTSPSDALSRLRASTETASILWIERPRQGRIFVALRGE